MSARFVYEVVEERVKESNGEKHTGYSILIKDGSCVVRKVYDVFTKRIEAEKFIGVCNREQVEPIHFDFVLEEWISKV